MTKQDKDALDFINKGINQRLTAFAVVDIAISKLLHKILLR